MAGRESAKYSRGAKARRCGVVMGGALSAFVAAAGSADAAAAAAGSAAAGSATSTEFRLVSKLSVQLVRSTAAAGSKAAIESVNDVNSG